MKKLAEKIALVTGSSRGIGRAIAKRLADDGAFVVVNYAENAQAANSLVDEILAGGGQALPIQAKLGSTSETSKLFSEFHHAIQARGRAARLDILVNNAGLPYSGKLSDATETEFDQVFTGNAKLPFLVTKSALQFLTTDSRVINISSGASQRPGTRFGLYAMAKAAVHSMTLAFAGELGPRGITVNTVAPGWTATEGNIAARQDVVAVRNAEAQTALGRLGLPSDIAGVVAFLASDDAGWITGQYLEVSGGYRLL